MIHTQHNIIHAAWRKCFFYMNQRGKLKKLCTLSVRKFPVDLRELLNKLATRLPLDRDQLVAELLQRDVGHFAATFEAIDKQLEVIDQWYESVTHRSK